MTKKTKPPEVFTHPPTTIAGADYGANLVSRGKPAPKAAPRNTLSHDLAREAALQQAMGPGYQARKAQILGALRKPEPVEPEYENCPECAGYGWLVDGEPDTTMSRRAGAVECHECGGLGEVAVSGDTAVCSRCEGDGAEPGNEGKPCNRCGGAGEVYWQTGLPATVSKTWKPLPPLWTAVDSLRAAQSDNPVIREYGKSRDRVENYSSCTEGRHWGLQGGAGIIPVAVIDGHPMVLLSHRSKLVQSGDTWSSFGGAIDPKDKSPFAAALRETFEEVQGLPTKGKILHKIEHPCHVCGWTYHTFVVLVEADWAKLVKVRVAKGHSSWETDEVAWAPDWLVGHYPLHPGFAKSWPEVHEAITRYVTKKASTS